MTKAIFFDLETSDKEPIGQIINYSFIAVDESLEPIAECSGDIRLSRLQLPSPDAILKNRVDVQALQRSDAPSEIDAMRGIQAFVESVQALDTKSPPILVGFNSNRFDVPRLRTSMMRNGLNPYFGGRIIYRDVLLGLRKLSISRADLPRPSKPGDPSRGEAGQAVLSLSLEEMTKALGLLTGAQSHHSRDDVLLTISLTKTLREQFDFDVLSYNPFEIQDQIAALARPRESNLLLWGLQPEYDVSLSSRYRRRPYTVLDANRRYVLLVDLEAYGEGVGRESVRWQNMSAASFFSGGAIVDDPVMETGAGPVSLQELSRRAKDEFKEVNLNNFFAQSSCDIEQDIYRVDSKGIDLLRRAIFEGDESGVRESKSRDLKVLLVRYRLREAKELDSKGIQLLKRYALHRYGGGLQLNKFPRIRPATEDAEEQTLREEHPSLKDYLSRIQELEAGVDGLLAKEDKALLESLKEFYSASEIVKFAGEELLSGQASLFEGNAPRSSSRRKAVGS